MKSLLTCILNSVQRKLILMIHHMLSSNVLPKAGVCNIDHVEGILQLNHNNTKKLKLRSHQCAPIKDIKGKVRCCFSNTHYL